jgi:adenylylsulfate kinase
MRATKESLLNQHAKVFWICGLSGAGKSTLASSLDKALSDRGHLSMVIDGDEVRKGLNKGLGFSDEDRRENLRRVAEVARLAVGNGIIPIVSFISPTRSVRNMIRSIIGDNDYVEVFVNSSLETCELRDPKGLYKQAREGMIKDFTGIDSPFEIPDHPDLEINTEMLNIEQSASRFLDFVLPMIEYN